jgi:class 3 adenylate cyclase
MGPFCDALSILLALRFAIDAAGPPAASSPTSDLSSPSQGEAETTDIASPRQVRLERLLFQHGASLDSLGKGALENAAVGVVKLPNWTTVAHRPPDAGGRVAMDAITQEVREAIERSDVDYAALLDDEIVLAAFPMDPAAAPRAATLVAMAMVEIRDRLTRLDEKWGIDLDFRLGMDVGIVMASVVASDPPSRNLWGGAIGIAKILASTAARHTIATSETAYELLASQFLLRPRGTYFLPESGNMRTFIMVGRL